MKAYWRISKHANLNGIGGEIADGRWHTKGLPIVYLAESPAGALLESLVHLEFSQRRLPETYALLKVEAQEELGILDLEPVDAGWMQSMKMTQSMGDAWLSDRKSPLARVPSVVVSDTRNILLNPRHPMATKLRIVSSSQERFDIRLFKFRTR